jgi:hypothetical protein
VDRLLAGRDVEGSGSHPVEELTQQASRVARRLISPRQRRPFRTAPFG